MWAAASTANLGRTFRCAATAPAPVDPEAACLATAAAADRRRGSCRVCRAMLLELHLKNVAVVAEASFELGSGLVVLTGETGAGKSIVVDALGLLAGNRASAEIIRAGADVLVVTGVFRPRGEAWRGVLAELGLDVSGDEVVLRREINRAGRNRVFVDDQPATARALVELAPHLLAIHGQRDEAALLSPEEQRGWLDVAGGVAAPPLLAAVDAAYRAWREAESRRALASGDDHRRLERLEMLRYQLEEIDAVAPLAGEDEALRRERDVLRHAETILAALDRARTALVEGDPSASELAGGAREALAGIAGWDGRAAVWIEQLDEALVRLDDVAVQVAGRLDEIEADPSRLAAVEDRLAELERLVRKHGGSCDEALRRRRDIAAELAQLEADVQDREGVERRAAEALLHYAGVAAKLTEARRAWGVTLAHGVVTELADLALGKARFEVTLGTRPRSDGPLEWAGERIEIGPAGVDTVSFAFAANPGEPLRPLAKVASGGELARVALALRLVARGDAAAPTATLVFDEVDSGVGGGEAAALGLKLQRVARGGQVLAVTHLPQVAAHGDRHLRVAKSVQGDRTFVAVEPLDDGEQVEEIARMLAGRAVTELSRSHARELLEVSRRVET